MKIYRIRYTGKKKMPFTMNFYPLKKAYTFTEGNGKIVQMEQDGQLRHGQFAGWVQQQAKDPQAADDREKPFDERFAAEGSHSIPTNNITLSANYLPIVKL